MGVGAGLYMCDVVKKSSRSLSHLLMSSCWVVAPAPMGLKFVMEEGTEGATYHHCGAKNLKIGL